jgi:ribonuclease HI/transposase InsO family protein
VEHRGPIFTEPL